MLTLVVGPSGAGKDTLLDGARQVLSGQTRFRFVRRMITRPPQPGMEDNDYVDPDTFRQMRAMGRFALCWEAHGLCYGIPADIADTLRDGGVVVASVSRGVLADAAARYPTRIVEIVAPPDILAARLAARGREGAADVTARLARTVPLPAGLAVTRLVNDRSVVEGVTGLVDLLHAIARTATLAREPDQGIAERPSVNTDR